MLRVINVEKIQPVTGSLLEFHFYVMKGTRIDKLLMMSITHWHLVISLVNAGMYMYVQLEPENIRPCILCAVTSIYKLTSFEAQSVMNSPSIFYTSGKMRTMKVDLLYKMEHLIKFCWWFVVKTRRICCGITVRTGFSMIPITYM